MGSGLHGSARTRGVTKNASTKRDTMQHPFDRVCDEHGIEHRLTKPYHPWTNGQAERMNRTVKSACNPVPS